LHGYYAKQNRLLLKDDSRIGANILKFAFFLWANWLLAFGIQYWVMYSVGWWMLFAALVAGGAVSMSLLLTVENGVALTDRKVEATTFAWILTSGIGFVVMSMMFSFDTPLLTLTKQERASYLYGTFQTNKMHADTLPRLECLSHPLYAITQAGKGNNDEASTHFLMHAESVSPEQRPVWLGFGHFFHGDFGSATESFETAGKEYQYQALLSKFRNDKLSAVDLKQFIESHTIGTGDLHVLDRIREVLDRTASPQKDGSMEQKVLENAAIRTELASLKKVALTNPKDSERISILKGLESLGRLFQDVERRTYAPPTISNFRQSEYATTLRSTVSREIKERMIELATVEAPVLPDMAHFDESYQARMNGFAVGGTPALYLLFLYLINAVWRDASKHVLGFLSRTGWHSRSAKSTAADLAKMEPGDEKGLFSEEIKRLNAWVFPADILLGWKYRLKARRVLRAHRIETQERDDVRFVYNEIRKLSGALIPHGNEQSLSIITALRERGETTVRNHRKGTIVFAFAREELLAIMRELLTLGDILEALGEKPEITKYHLLGLEPALSIDDKTIKQAYHSIMKAIHPDRNPGDKFLENLARLVNESYAVLGNRNRRRAYETAIRL